VKTLRVYFGGSLRARPMIRDLVSRLPGGVESTSSWLMADINPGRPKERIVEGAVQDFKDLSGSDVFVQCYPHIESTTGGVNTELGISLALGLPCFVLGDRSGPIEAWGLRYNIFHWMPSVRFVETDEALFNELSALRK
jgi:hypothetical protein